jgi:hypothetical protein
MTEIMFQGRDVIFVRFHPFLQKTAPDNENGQALFALGDSGAIIWRKGGD